jgi:ADP-ribose pyrophosphatase YjhB (NUDIX family)
MEVALGLIRQGDDFVLQKRPNDPDIGAAGLIGCFGGKVESGEHANKAMTVAREVGEESTLITQPEDWTFVCDFPVYSDYRREVVEVRAHIFAIVIESHITVEAREGEIVRAKVSELDEYLDRMTPATQELARRII